MYPWRNILYEKSTIYFMYHTIVQLLLSNEHDIIIFFYKTQTNFRKKIIEYTNR